MEKLFILSLWEKEFHIDILNILGVFLFMYKEVSFEQVKGVLETGEAVVIDVREPQELVEAGAISGDYNLLYIYIHTYYIHI